MKNIHYIAMSGMRGYIPNYVASYELFENAVDDLAMLHDLSGEEIEELRKYKCLELNLEIHGNEYCEIVRCDCKTPEIHNE